EYLARRRTMDRIEVAEDYLRTAVYRWRERRASAPAGADAAGGQCGLGTAPSTREHSDAEADSQHDVEANERFSRLWPEGLDEFERARVDEVEERWIREQDTLDRKRNHFLKDFRREHGFDRRAYSTDVLAAYESGLE